MIVRVLPFLKEKQRPHMLRFRCFVFLLTSKTKLEKFSEEPYKCVKVNKIKNFRALKGLHKSEILQWQLIARSSKKLKEFLGGVADSTNPEAKEVYQETTSEN